MIGVVMPAEIAADRHGEASNGKRSRKYRPTLLVMVFDTPEQLAEIRRLLNGEPAAEDQVA